MSRTSTVTAALTSLRFSIAALVSARILGVAGGIALNGMWQQGAVQVSLGVPVGASPSAMTLLGGNVKGAALVGVLSAVTGGAAGIVFNVTDGVRYGLSVAQGVTAAPARGWPAAVAGLAFPWLEFLAVSVTAAVMSVLFWRLWFGRRPLFTRREVASVSLTIAVCLVVAAEVEAWLLQ